MAIVKKKVAKKKVTKRPTIKKKTVGKITGDVGTTGQDEGLKQMLDGLGDITKNINKLNERIDTLEEQRPKFSTEEFAREQKRELNENKKNADAKDRPVVQKYKHAVGTDDAQIGKEGVLAFEQSEDPEDDSVGFVPPDVEETDSEYDLLDFGKDSITKKGLTPKQRRERGLPPPEKTESWKKAMMFYNQKISIHIQDTSEPNADGVFTIGVDGKQWMFIRDLDYSVPRYVVEGLARAKPITYKNEEYTTKDGRRDYRQPFKTGVRYNFHVLHDPAGKAGEVWLRNILSQI